MSNFRFTKYDSFPPVIKNLIIINVLVWVAQLIYDKENGQVTLWLTSKLGLWSVNTPFFKPYQVVTSMFAHESYEVTEFDPSGHLTFFHILFNMFALFMFGRVLENVWGAKRFLFFYLACGLGASLTHIIMQSINGEISVALGASGAIMGVLVAFGYLFPNTELHFFGVLPVKAKWVVLGLILVDLFGGFGRREGDNIGHFAHLGGALTGFIIVWIWNKTNRKTLY